MMASRKNQCKTYKASITREPFLFYEMRTTAKLMVEGLSNDEIIERIVVDNLFQYDYAAKGRTI